MKYLWLYLKGIAMGSADVVPGVSGGTIAFITGIYTELLDSIKSVNISALVTLYKQGPKAAWQAINGTFLLVLLLGILSAILTLAKVIHYLLDQHAILLWSFF
ncbi:MAG: putative membrane protein, partial [Marinoscillum sp.]